MRATGDAPGAPNCPNAERSYAAMTNTATKAATTAATTSAGQRRFFGVSPG